MKPQFYKYFFLAIFLSSFHFIQAQITYTITQDVVYSLDPNCDDVEFNTQDPWTGANLKLNMTHDIFNNPSSPYLRYTVNNNGFRYIYFDVYDVNGAGVETLEATITKYSSILYGGINSGSSSTDYNLDVLDLMNAGITSGFKRVRVRVRMTLSNLAWQVNGVIQKNGVTECTETPLDGSDFTCDIGLVDCFNYTVCGNLSVNGLAYLDPIYDIFGNIVGFNTVYSYTANISGGSGNYTYFWSGNGTPAFGNQSTYNFTLPSGKPDVYLQVVDNVTGCMYYWESRRARKTQEVFVDETLGLQVGPNPASTSSQITLQLDLPSNDQFDLDIFDINGRMVLDLPAGATGPGGAQKLTLDPNLAPGMYLIRLQTEEHGSRMKKLIVQ